MKRSELSRTPEKARAWRCKRRDRIKPVSAKRAREARMRMIVRDAVFHRDGWTCQAKGWRIDCFGSLTYHHLLKASQGGEFTVDNGLSMCQAHNDLVEDHPAEALALGFVRRRWS